MLLAGTALLAVACGGSPAQVVAPAQVAETAQAQIGPAGGELTLDGATLTVPAGAVTKEESFFLQRLETAPAPVEGDLLSELPGGTQVNYSVSSSAASFSVPLTIKFSTEARGMVSAIYSYAGSGKRASFTEDWLMEVYGPGNVIEATIGSLPTGADGVARVIVLFSQKRLADQKAACNAEGGVFNGVWCMEPWQPGPQSQGIKVLSLQAGNADAWCMYPDYLVKLCDWRSEQAVRKLIQAVNPDIIAIQEFYNGACGFQDLSTARVCGPVRPDPGFGEQIKRVLFGAPYEYSCAHIANGKNGYECVAIKSTQFEFVNKEVAYLSGGCLEEDTGFQVVRIRPKNLVGPVPPTLADIEIANAHLASPAKDGDGSCRMAQLEALSQRYKYRGPGTPDDPWVIGSLVLGDFNVDPNREVDLPGDAADVPIPEDLREGFKNLIAYGQQVNASLGRHLFYTHTDPHDGSQDGGFGLTLDHVASNFASHISCSRMVPAESLFGVGAAFDHLSTVCELARFGSATIKADAWRRDPAGSVAPSPTIASPLATSKGVRLRPQQFTYPSTPQYPSRVDLYSPSNVPTLVTYTLDSCPVKPTEARAVPTLDSGQVFDLGKVYIDASPYTCPNP